MIEPATILRRVDSMVYRQIGDEAVLVPIRGNCADLENIYTLNPVGAAIWGWLDGSRSVARIIELLVLGYEIPADEAGRDLSVFLEQLLALGAVERA